MIDRISQRASTPASSIAGSSVLASIAQLTGPIQCGQTKAAQIYKKTGNLRAVQLLLGTQSSKARSATSALRLMMPWQYNSGTR